MAVRIHNGLTPALAEKARRLKDRRPVLEAMGAELVSITKRAFTDASLRPAAWPLRKDGGGGTQGRDGRGRFKTIGNPLLRKSGALWHSIAISAITQDHVDVSTDKPYAVTHQLGSRNKSGRGGGIPPRPFFPWIGGRMTPDALRRISGVAKAKLAAILKD